MKYALAAAAALFGALGAGSANAVIVLDSTWAEEGGTVDDPAAGFGAHIDYAHEPQFDAVVAFSSDGDTWGDCTGTWIGNDRRSAYVLTAGHCFDEGYKATTYIYRTEGGTVLTGKAVYRHPRWTGSQDDRTGYDMAIVRLNGRIRDAGPQPLLYGGDAELGQLLSFAGFGNRGIGSIGEDEAFYDFADDYDQKAAGQGTIDQVVEAEDPLPGAGNDAGNYLGIYLPKEDGSVPNPYGGATVPATRLAGLLGSGDSGSGAWFQLDDGRWVLAGVASDGSPPAAYGDSSWFARISTQRAWILSVFPGAKFAAD